MKAQSQSQNVDLRSTHKYLGYATAALAGITAATFSSGNIHEIAGYTTAGLSLITTGIGFYEYGEYFDLDEGYKNCRFEIDFRFAKSDRLGNRTLPKLSTHLSAHIHH